MGFQVASAAETLVTHLALVGFLSCVDQIVFLQVGELSETFIAGLTLKGSFPTMDTQVHLKIRKLTKGLGANIALILDLPILLLKWVIKTFVACGTSFHLAQIDGLIL